MPTAADVGPTGALPVTAREDRGFPGGARVCPILRTVLDAHGRGRAEVRLDLLARLVVPLPG
ncbi:hypothetical protein [Saccharothrix syringae]|uniref:Uncharacterized protein n=1 Tax=Saccharothrix syringae TaxID=103733 RepID=A0A5Q0GST7_SACSY|nr:hypothetical protein [Saccharothrix syringae]QFZ16560.1 hypothetical protein EKG83_02935 [Saccharothrix syringae]